MSSVGRRHLLSMGGPFTTNSTALPSPVSGAFSDLDEVLNAARKCALRFGLSTADAEDVAQLAALAFMTQRQVVRDPAAWTRLVAGRFSTRLRRNERARTSEPLNDGLPDQTSVDPSLQVEIFRALQQGRVAQQSPWWRHKILEEDLKTLAEDAGVSLSTIKRRINREGEWIRKRLAPGGRA